jgi:hypothetical protein
VLATASTNSSPKDREHLSIFNRVFATENGVNLSGPHKSRKIVSELGERSSIRRQR